MVSYTCDRCGFTEIRKHHFIRHLRRKYPCLPKIKDVPVEELLRNHLNYKYQVKSDAWREFIKKMTPNDPDRPILTPNEPSIIPPSKSSRAKKYQCEGCKKHFSKNCHMRRHEKKCSQKQHLDRLDDLDQQIALKEHETSLIKAERKSKTVNIGTQNNATNCNNTTNNVTVNILPYEQTDVSHLTDRDYQRAFNRASMCVPQILEKIHFDPEKPQNHNVYISSMNNKYIKLHNGERWNLRDREETIEDLFADAEYMLENKLETWQEEEDPKSERATKKFQIYLEVKEKEALYNKIKQELKFLLFNNRSLITET